MSDTATISYNGESIEVPVVTGSQNEKGLVIKKLRGATGLVTLDPGYKNTGSTESAITFLNGEEGILRYRGYPIEDLASKATFTEVCYLLVFGKLPNKAELDKWNHDITHHTLVHEDLKKFFDSIPLNSHPMGTLMSLIASLSNYYPESQDPNRSESDKVMTIVRLLAKMPTLVSWIYKKSVGHPIVYPNNKLDYVSNFLNMTFGHRTEETEVDPVIAEAMNTLLILHADHEQNCSTSTVRIVGSSHANLYASISAGVAALWGPLHGGANQAVLEMLENIRKDGGDVQKYLDKARDKEDPFRLMGFGHRVYKNFDPRAKIIKVAADNVLEKLGVEDPILEVAKGLEEAALKDQYFVDRKLYPNVDFYSGIIYRAMGFPTEMFTVLFALGRLPGWIAQWKELRDTNQPIGRPRQIYTGDVQNDWVDIDNR